MLRGGIVNNVCVDTSRPAVFSFSWGRESRATKGTQERRPQMKSKIPMDANTLAFLQEQRRFRKWAGEVARTAATKCREIAQRHSLMGNHPAAKEWEQVAVVMTHRYRRNG